jgi:anti-sigma regulatory factor (Ser/Thr protein kinase)
MEYVAGISAFARAGLGRGEPVMLVVPGFRAEPLRQALGRDADRVTFADMTQVGRNPGRIIPAVREFLDRHAGRRVSCVGEYVWPGRRWPEITEAARHEALSNLAFADAPMTALCPFDTTRLPAGVLSAARQAHPLAAEADGPVPSKDYLGPGEVPPLCDEPLPQPPPNAEVLGYRADLRPVRELAGRRATQAGLSPVRADDLITAVSELAANTIRHTPGNGILRIWQTLGELVCEICDQGWIANPLAGRCRPAATAGGGLGLPLVHQVCDLVETRTDPASGTIIRLHMSLRG